AAQDAARTSARIALIMQGAAGALDPHIASHRQRRRRHRPEGSVGCEAAVSTKQSLRRTKWQPGVPDTTSGARGDPMINSRRSGQDRESGGEFKLVGVTVAGGWACSENVCCFPVAAEVSAQPVTPRGGVVADS